MVIYFSWSWWGKEELFVSPSPTHRIFCSLIDWNVHILCNVFWSYPSTCPYVHHLISLPTLCPLFFFKEKIIHPWVQLVLPIWTWVRDQPWNKGNWPEVMPLKESDSPSFRNHLEPVFPSLRMEPQWPFPCPMCWNFDWFDLVPVLCKSSQPLWTDKRNFLEYSLTAYPFNIAAVGSPLRSMISQVWNPWCRVGLISNQNVLC